MEPVTSIRRLGFRRWYERQLFVSHLSLTTCLLCGILIAAFLEEGFVLEFSGSSVLRLGIVFAAGAGGWHAWRRYITVLERAERYGERSTCPDCRTYARFDIVHSGIDTIPGPAATAVAPLEAAWLRVRCRKCGAAWRMPD